MPGLDRLSASDLLTMQSAQAGWPMDIGVVAVFDGAALVDADGRFRIEAVRATVGRRLRRVPRVRQVLHVPPRLLGPPWKRTRRPKKPPIWPLLLRPGLPVISWCTASAESSTRRP